MGRLKHICSNCNNYQMLHHEEGCVITLKYTKSTDECNNDSFEGRFQFDKEDEEAYREHMERD